MPENTKVLLSFNDRLHKLVEEQLKADIQNGDSKTLFVAFILGKAFKTYEAVLLLCRNGYGEDAFMLTRTLFELMVTNSYILQDETDDRLMRYINYDWVTRKEMYDYIASSPALLTQLNADIESGKRVNTIPEVEAGYQKVMDKYKYRNGWSDKSIKGMSEAIGREDMYSTVYRLQCTISHTNARSMNEYGHQSDEGSIFNIGPNWDMVRTTLVIAFDCFFHITKEVDKKFSWNLAASLDSLAEEYAKAMASLPKP